MSFLDGENLGTRIGGKAPGKDEKCSRCGKPPAAMGMDYCTKCGQEYAATLGAKIKIKGMRKIAKPRPEGIKTANTKLSPEDVAVIREYVACGGKQKDMCIRYQVSAATISNIANNKRR